MTNLIADKLVESGWVVKSKNGLVVSAEIDTSLYELYRKIENNEEWRKEFVSAFGDPAKPINDVFDLSNFCFQFSFGMRGFLPKELCDEIEHWCLDNDTPLGQIIGAEDFLCRYQIVPFALYNFFVILKE